MDRISDFLSKVQENCKYELLAVEQNIERLNLQIVDFNKSIFDIEASIDNSYAVLSASGSADEVKTAELVTLRDLLKEHESELAKEIEEKVRLEKDIAEIRELIDLYKNQIKAYGGMTSDDIIVKLDFISRLVKVDSVRAIEEIELLKTVLEGKQV